MPWQESSIMSLRREFVALAGQEGVNARELCRRYGISAKTGEKWLGRARADGEAGLADRSRRPATSPRRTAAVAARVVDLRQEHPTRGGRKIHHWLRARGAADAPRPSTVTAILRRHGLVTDDPAPPAAGSGSSTTPPTTGGRSTSSATAPSRTVSGCTR